MRHRYGSKKLKTFDEVLRWIAMSSTPKMALLRAESFVETARNERMEKYFRRECAAVLAARAFSDPAFGEVARAIGRSG